MTKKRKGKTTYGGLDWKVMQLKEMLKEFSERGFVFSVDNVPFTAEVNDIEECVKVLRYNSFGIIDKVARRKIGKLEFGDNVGSQRNGNLITRKVKWVLRTTDRAHERAAKNLADIFNSRRKSVVMIQVQS